VIIKRRLLPLGLVGTVLVAALLTALLSSSMTGAEHRMQIPEFTPTAFNYLPLVTKDWPSPLVANLWLINNSSTDVCEVYFSPPSEPWGKNRLVGGETIAPGGSALWTIPAGIYDLWVRGCSQNTLSLLWYQSVSGNYYWVIPPGPEPTPTPTPQDTQGPVIGRIGHSPSLIYWDEYDQCQPTYPISVTINAYDISDPSGVSAVKVTYRVVEAGRPAGQWQSKNMTTAQTGMYSATIGPNDLELSLNPPVSYGYGNQSTLEYYIQAFDGVGNRTDSTTSMVIVQYCYIIR
jgi:hypothetical protein